jgi:hypothetical protein
MDVRDQHFALAAITLGKELLETGIFPDVVVR